MTDGERWAVSELDALRFGRFGPRAWHRFLAASFRRAAETRRDRPRLVRQARAWSIAGLAGAVAVSVGASRARLPAPRPWRCALWSLATCAMLDWHLGMVEGPAGENRELLSAADALTLVRIWSVPLLAAQGDPARSSRPMFTALIAAAAASDTLDGAIARRIGPTRLGSDLDKAADALTLAAASRAAGRARWLPPGAARLLAVRSGLPVAAVAATYFRTGHRPPIETFGASRRLAPVLLGALAVTPFWPAGGAAVTSLVSVASLALDRRRSGPPRRSPATHGCAPNQGSGARRRTR